MKVEDITKAVIEITGQKWDKQSPEARDRAISDVQYVLDNPKTGVVQWHKQVCGNLDGETPNLPYKKVPAKEKAVYKTILATIKALKGIQTGSDEKGDFVECETVVQSDMSPEQLSKKGIRGIDWSHKGLDLKTVSTPKNKPEGF